jgi:2,3-dihydroxyphenylpropionate 1,2-dioxygenase
MPFATCCMSHTPLLERAHPAVDVRQRVCAALERARSFVRQFDPELVVIFGPDHYQGFHYEVMPPFCIATAATSVGDYDTRPGPLDVPQALVDELVAHVLHSDIDTAVSEAMRVDHGMVQPLEKLFGSADARPVIPVFVNSVAEPLGPPRRARLLGDAIGRFLARLDRRVLIVGSGGLSHDPPIPALRQAPPEVAAKLVSERRTPQEQARREEFVLAAAREFAAGTSDMRPLNPRWDRSFLELVASGELERFDEFTNASLVEDGGKSSQEVRTWVAAHAALAAAGGPYRTTYQFYEPVPEWIIGFALITTESIRDAASPDVLRLR